MFLMTLSSTLPAEYFQWFKAINLFVPKWLWRRRLTTEKYFFILKLIEIYLILIKGMVYANEVFVRYCYQMLGGVKYAPQLYIWKLESRKIKLQIFTSLLLSDFFSNFIFNVYPHKNTYTRCDGYILCK